MKGSMLGTQLSGDCERPDLCVIGLGYIGLPTALVFSELLPNVVGVDNDRSKIEALAQAESTIPEHGIQDKMRDAVSSGRLRFSLRPVAARTYIIAVPTPMNEDKKVDMSMVEEAVDSISNLLVGDELIVIESTSPPGSTEGLRKRLAHERPDLTFEEEHQDSVHVVYCPERVLPGAIFEELRSNSRIVGGDSSVAIQRAKELYAGICSGEISTTDSKTAELAKLTENAFRDVNIAFANEVSMVADEIGADGLEVIELANRHPRVDILDPGPGVGGHCIAVDPWFIVGAAPNRSRIIQTARAVNDFKAHWVVEKVAEQIEDGRYRDINVLGLSFKANVDDLRLSPSIDIVSRLARKYPQIRIHTFDPYVAEKPKELEGFSNVNFCHNRDNLVPETMTVLLVAHSVYLDWIRKEFLGKSLLDFTGKVIAHRAHGERRVGD